MIDSTFIESAYGGPEAAPNGYKRATGCSVHVLIDKTQSVLAFAALPGNRHDAEGAQSVLPLARHRFPSLKLVLGDRAYRQRPLTEFASEFGIVIDGASPALPKGQIFKPMPLRWKVEQFFAWLSKWRRIAKNWCYSLKGFCRDVEWSLLGLSLRRAARAR